MLAVIPEASAQAPTVREQRPHVTEGVVTIDAPPALVYKVATDYVRWPAWFSDVVDTLAALPAALKMGDELQTQILRRRNPEFLDVVNSNTGARMGAGKLEASLATLRMKVSAKLGVKGYQPYERLGLWLRRELRPLVERVVVSDSLLSRGVVHPDAVRRVVNEHMNGANRTFLLMSLLIFEMGQQSLDAPHTRQ